MVAGSALGSNGRKVWASQGTMVGNTDRP